MSILNVNQIQPVGSGQTVTINAANISAGSATLTAGTFSGNLSGNVTGNLTGNLTGNVTGNVTGNLTGSVNLTTGITTVAAGSTSAPSITPTGDSNTGIFFPAADIIAFAEGGVEAARFDSNGRLGIGTNNPGAPLHVVSNSSAEGIRLAGRSTDNIGSFYFRNNADSATYGLIQGRSTELRISSESASQPITFYTDSEKARIDTSGRLLINTTNTAGTQLLKVNGSTSGTIYGGTMSLTQGRTPPNGSTLGVLYFGSEANPEGGPYIAATAEGAWTAGSSHPSNIVFGTTPSGASGATTRMNLSSLGTINTLAADDTLRLSMTYGAGNSYYYILGGHTSSNVGSGTISFRVTSNGNVQNTNGSYTAISDFKLKENIVDAASQWDDLKAIRIRNWNFKEETGHETHRQIGPIAQELEEVCPGLVFESPDRDVDGNDLGTTTKGVNQSILYMKAVKALQEAMDRIETLESRLDALENS